jgi:hypothetical protein
MIMRLVKKKQAQPASSARATTTKENFVHEEEVS